MVTKELKTFTLVNGEPYFQGSSRVLARFVSKAEAR